MKAEIKELKDKLKKLPPVVVYNKLDLYKIPTPLKEIIILTCIDKMSVEPARDALRNRYNINLGYWDFISKTREALKKFHESERLY